MVRECSTQREERILSVFRSVSITASRWATAVDALMPGAEEGLSGYDGHLFLGHFPLKQGLAGEGDRLPDLCPTARVGRKQLAGRRRMQFDADLGHGLQGSQLQRDRLLRDDIRRSRGRDDRVRGDDVWPS